MLFHQMEEESSSGDFLPIARSAGLSVEITCANFTPSKYLISLTLFATNTDRGLDVLN